MGYFKTQDIISFINSSCLTIQIEKHTPITDPKEALAKLSSQEDLIGFFWLQFSADEDNGVGIKMEGKVFVRLDNDVYTDDRFALDSYHAAKEGLSVTDIIKKREDEKKNAKNSLNPDSLENIKKFLSDKAT